MFLLNQLKMKPLLLLTLLLLLLSLSLFWQHFEANKSEKILQNAIKCRQHKEQSQQSKHNCQCPVEQNCEKLKNQKIMNLGGLAKLLSSIPQMECQLDDRLPTVLTRPSCMSAFLHQRRSKDNSYLIPPILHFSWKDTQISRYMMRQIKTWHDFHPNWKFVFWRDSDIHHFLNEYFPTSVLRDLFYKIPSHIPGNVQRFDMIRYLILYKFGGVFPDLDVKLVSNIDELRRMPFVVMRHPEAMSIFKFGLYTDWPLPIYLMTAVQMSIPGHIMHNILIEQLTQVSPKLGPQYFAGPKFLSSTMAKMSKIFPYPIHHNQTVYVTPSRNFFPIKGIKMIPQKVFGRKVKKLKNDCESLNKQKAKPQIIKFCSNITNMDAITNPEDSVYGVHDYTKDASSYSPNRKKFYDEDLMDVRKVMPYAVMGSDFMRTVRS